MSLLTPKQKEELHYAMLDYLRQQPGFEKTAETFASELDPEQPSQPDSSDNKNDNKKYQGLLEKKWTSIIRLQKKVLELEQKLQQAMEEISRLPLSISGKKSSAAAIGMLELLPRAPERMTLNGHRMAITRVTWHPIFNIVASASEDCSIKVWDCDDPAGQLLHTLKAHTKSVNSICFHPKGTLLASCSTDLTIKLWDTENNYNCIKTLHGHDHSVSDVVFSPAGDHLFSASRDKSIKMWDVGTGYCVKSFFGHDEWVRSIRCSDDGLLLLSGSSDQTARVWDVGSGECKATLTGHDHVVECAVFVPAEAVSILTKELLKQQSASSDNNAPKPIFIVTGSRDKTIRIWDYQMQKCVYTLNGHDNWIRAFDFLVSTATASKESLAFLVSASDDKSVKVWDLKSGRCTRTIEAHSHFVSSVAVMYSRAGVLMATGSVDSDLKIWTSSTNS